MLTDQARTRTFWRIVLGWTMVALCCALLWAWEKSLQNDQRLANNEAGHRRAVSWEVSRIFTRHFGQTPEQLRAQLKLEGPLATFQTNPDYPTIQAKLDAAAIKPQFKGYKVGLMFHPGWGQGPAVGLMEVSVEAPPPQHFKPPTLETLANMEFTQHAALLLGAGTWVLGFITTFFARPWRRQIAQVCLAGALVAAVAWTISPARVWQRSDLLAPLPLCIAAAGLFSVLALIVPVRRRPRDPASCAGCGYDLTGNESGVCPECGRPRRVADRWQAEAEQLRELDTA